MVRSLAALGLMLLVAPLVPTIASGQDMATRRANKTILAQEREVLNRVTQRIEWDKQLTGSTLKVEVQQGGSVFLRGSVMSDSAKARAVDLVENTTGVTSVTDELAVVKSVNVIDATAVTAPAAPVAEVVSRTVPAPEIITRPAPAAPSAQPDYPETIRHPATVCARSHPDFVRPGASSRTWPGRVVSGAPLVLEVGTNNDCKSPDRKSRICLALRFAILRFAIPERESLQIREGHPVVSVLSKIPGGCWPSPYRLDRFGGPRPPRSRATTRGADRSHPTPRLPP